MLGRYGKGKEGGWRGETFREAVLGEGKREEELGGKAVPPFCLGGGGPFIQYWHCESDIYVEWNVLCPIETAHYPCKAQQ